MREVHLARDTRLGRKVAIKLLLANKSDRGISSERFQIEARAVSSLNHPHNCTPYDVGEQNGRDYLVTELLEGETIAGRLTRGRCRRTRFCVMPSRSPRRSTMPIGTGSFIAIWPGNVMLTKTGAKLLDFGLARWYRKGPSELLESLETTTRETPLTGDGQVVGTLRYMAPEQLEGKPVDVRTDLFGFGALVHEMAIGRRAFEAASEASIVAAILRTDPPESDRFQQAARQAVRAVARDPALGTLTNVRRPSCHVRVHVARGKQHVAHARRHIAGIQGASDHSM